MSRMPQHTHPHGYLLLEKILVEILPKKDGIPAKKRVVGVCVLLVPSRFVYETRRTNGLCYLTWHGLTSTPHFDSIQKKRGVDNVEVEPNPTNARA
jgi:hypothetical protein